MAEYYRNCPSAPTRVTPAADENAAPTVALILSEFDKYRKTLLSDDAEEGWASELRCYLGTMQWDVTKDTDLVEWWQVSALKLRCFYLLIEVTEPCSVVPNSRAYRP